MQVKVVDGDERRPVEPESGKETDANYKPQVNYQLMVFPSHHERCYDTLPQELIQVSSLGLFKVQMKHRVHPNITCESRTFPPREKCK